MPTTPTTDRRGEILDAALAIADEDGLAAVTMRAVAARVGVTPMALYPYVGTKQSLIDGIVERLLIELPKPDPDADWRDRLRALARSVREVAKRHPHCFGLLVTRPAENPDEIAGVEVIFQALLDAGVPPAQVPRVERMASTLVLGYGLSEISGRFDPGTKTPRQRRAQLPAGELPAHHALAEYLDAKVDWDAEYDADVEDLLRLIELIASRP